MIDQTVSHYQITEKLGQGGMGVVYKAEDTRLRRTVALKFLPPELTRDDDARGRFVREAQAASALDHAHICNIHEIGETEDGQLFIVMGYYAGETIKKKLKRGPLPMEEVVEITMQIAEGLARAHERGIIHRDIKPANVMVTDRGVVKILDFGLAKLVGAVDLTKAGSTLGTVAYMSPEQARGEIVDARTDIWALGVVLYEMLAGRRPFQGDYAQAIIYALLNVEPAPLASLREDVSQALVQVVEKALAKQADERYARIDELLIDLQALRTSGQDRLIVSETPAALSPGPFKAEHHVVGRERERAQLREALASVAASRGLIIGVAGEPGIGKTTLVETFLHEANIDGSSCLIARGQCSERLAGTEAYLPILDVLESLHRQDASIAATMRRLAPVWYLQVVPPTSAEATDPALRGAVQGATQERMKRELASFLQDLAQRHPLVLVFEDLHWADVSTIDLLVYLAARFDELRVLVVATYRPEDLRLADHAFLKVKPDLQARGRLHELTLDFLSLDEVAAYLALECPTHAFPASFAKLIHGHTEGSPLFMADLVRDLRDRGVIEEVEEGWGLAQSVPEIQLGLPESVQGMIQRKIERLREEDRRLLVAASVQGNDFDSAVVAVVLDVKEEELEDRLERLEAVHAFVQYVGEVTYPGGGFTLRYRFVHALYQNALYASLRPTRRARMSRAVAEALLSKYGAQSEAVASAVAVLFEAARDYGRAAKYFCTAAQRASQVFAYQEAEGLARRGLAQLDPLPETPERAHQELMLHMALGIPLTYTRGWGAVEAKQTYARARELCRQVGEARQLVSVLCGLAVFYMNRAELQTARELGEQMLQLAQHEGDTALLLEAHHILGDILLGLGAFASAREHYDWVVAHYDQEQHGSRAFVLEDPGVGCLSVGPVVLWLLGYPDKAKVWAEEALTLARALSHPFNMTFALSLVSTFHQYCRDGQATQERAEAAVVLADEQGFPLWTAWGTFMKGWALAAQGQAEEGVVQIRKGWADYSSTGSLYWQSYILALLADAYGKAKQIEKGLQTLAEAFATVEKTGERIYEAEMHRLQGELLLMQGGADAEAEGCFQSALDVARQQQARSFELRAATSMARLWQQQGKRKEAHTLLREIYNWFTEGFDTADLKDAQALLDELQPPALTEKPVPSIAVLPFTDMSPQRDQEYFCDGMAEEVIADLSPVRALRVISRTSSMMLKGTPKDVRTIGRELDVQYVLEGSVRKAGNQLRITAQLIDAVNDVQLWAEKYRGTLDDVFEIQEHVSRAIVTALQIRLSSEEDAAIAERPIPNLLAYDYYLRARHDIYASNAKSLDRALANLERGLELTGKNSVILRGMGLVKFQLVNMGIDSSEKHTEELLEIASALEEINPTSADGPLLKGLFFELQGDAKRCMRDLRIAHVRDPADQDAMFWLCIGSCSTGQVALARCLADKLVSTDPLMPLVPFFVGYTAFFDGKADEGLDAVRRALEIGAKEVPAGLWGSVRIMAAAGCMKEARQLATVLDERHPDAPFSAMARGFILALDGAVSEARSALTPEIEVWAGSVAEWAQFIGDYYAVLGDSDQALEWLERAVSLGFLNAAFLAQGDPFLQVLRGDSRFQDLIARTEQELSAFEKTLLPVECQ